MYCFLEIETIFRNCLNWEELERACNCFLSVMIDGDLTNEHRLFIAEKSNERFRQIENL
jgi:hypothetical protein